MKDWFDRLLNPEESPSSFTLISVLAGMVGLIIIIISTFIETLQTSETIETSKFLVRMGLGGKALQTVLKKVKKNE